MQVEFKHKPAFALAVVSLTPNETIKVEPGAMVSFSAGITSETAVAGGILGGLKRVLGGESFFQNTYTAPAEGGEITLAPTLPGDIDEMDIIPGQQLLLKSGAYLAASPEVSFDASWGGARGFFGGPGLILLRVTGQGKLLFASYGGLELRTLAAGQRYTVDTDHIVAMDGSINFQVRGMGSLKRTVFGGEGFVCELTGPGRVYMQSRSESEFLGWLIPKLPHTTSTQ